MLVLPRSDGKYRKDEELVRLALGGDDKAMAELIAQVMPIAKAKAAAQQAKNSRLSAEDLVQEGMLGFLSALNSYSADKGSSFRTYAGACIGNRIITAVRLHNNMGNFSLTSAVPIDGEDGSISAVDPEDIVLEREKFDDIAAFISGKGALSPLETKVVECRLSGLSYSATAEKLGVTQKAVDNALARVRKKVRSL